MTDAVLPEEIIVNNIYSIRGHKGMFGVCLAELYQLGTGQLKRQVRGNPERFPDGFMFELTPGGTKRFKVLIWHLKTRGI